MICTTSVQSFWPVTRTFLHPYGLNQLKNVQKEGREKRFPVPKFNRVMVKLGKKEGNHIHKHSNLWSRYIFCLLSKYIKRQIWTSLDSIFFLPRFLGWSLHQSGLQRPTFFLAKESNESSVEQFLIWYMIVNIDIGRYNISCEANCV